MYSTITYRGTTMLAVQHHDTRLHADDAYDAVKRELPTGDSVEIRDRFGCLARFTA